MASALALFQGELSAMGVVESSFLGGMLVVFLFKMSLSALLLQDNQKVVLLDRASVVFVCLLFKCA